MQTGIRDNQAWLRGPSVNNGEVFPRTTSRGIQADAQCFALARIVEERDSSLGRHCERLTVIASAIGVLLGLSVEELSALQRAGYLHDIGKIALPDHLLLKAGPLDRDEWELMKTHPARGEEICRDFPSLEDILPIIRHHHERWDGSGYPDGLKEEEIPLLARILQIADIYEALTSERPYKRAYSPAEALAIMREETQKGWRDPRLVPVLAEVLPLFESESFWELAPLSLSMLALAVQKGNGSTRNGSAPAPFEAALTPTTREA